MCLDALERSSRQLLQTCLMQKFLLDRFSAFGELFFDFASYFLMLLSFFFELSQLLSFRGKVRC